MLVNCNSCHKKFEVPDSAITEAGRLLQCGSCGNKWTQYPIKEKQLEKIQKVATTEIEKPNKQNVKKTSFKRKKREINLYSEEYLKKKHNLTIKNIPHNNKKNKISGLGFYSYLILISILVTALIGALNLTKEIIITKYPLTESYINYLYEVIDIIKITIFNFI
jgi:predicted Zn finger-like uncharacterized protein